MTPPSVLEGINDRTSRADLLKRLREVAKTIVAMEDERIARMQEIEEKVRGQANVVDLRKVIVSATPQEWRESEEFLSNFEDYLPSTLARVLEGAKEVNRK